MCLTLARLFPGLYINVYSPNTRNGSQNSVLVWIHGGGFIEGSGYDAEGPYDRGGKALYDAHTLCSRTQTVIFTFNYRLGVLGKDTGFGVGGNLSKLPNIRQFDC